MSFFRRFVEIITKHSSLEDGIVSYHVQECKELYEFIDRGIPIWKNYKQKADKPDCDDDDSIPFNYLREIKNFNIIPKDAELSKYEKMVLLVYHRERPKIKHILKEKRRKFYYDSINKYKSIDVGKRKKKKPVKKENELVELLNRIGIDYTIPSELLESFEKEKEKEETHIQEDEAQWFIDWQGMSSSDEEFYGAPIAGDPGSVDYIIPTTTPVGLLTKFFNWRKHQPQDGKVYIPFSNDVSRLFTDIKCTDNMYFVSDKPISIENLPDIPQDPNSPLYKYQQTAKREFFYEHRDELRYIIQQEYPHF